MAELIEGEGKHLFVRLRDPGEPTDAQKRSGQYAKRKVAWKGLTLSVENEAGDIRRGVGSDGPWATLMHYAYGFVNRTEGVDGDQVDVYLGPEMDDAPMVYVVHQRRYGAWDEYDEDKCMLGFLSEESARDAYLSCYDDPRFLGPITAMPVAEFIDKVRATRGAPAMIKSLFVAKSFVAPYLRDGKPVHGYDNHRHRRLRPEKVDLFSTAAGADPHHERLEALSKRVVRFASGLTRVNDFMPAAHAGSPVGVEAGELSEVAIERLAEAVVDWKTQLFVDSGAFGAFMSAVKSGARPEPLSYETDVFPVYDRLLDRIGELNESEERLPPPLLVMPDVVDDQIASLNLIARHAAYVKATIDFSGVARAIIPIQRGPLSMAEAYRELVRILGTDDFIVGIPSNAAAITADEFKAFLGEAKPRGVHILGALADSRLNPRLSQIVESGHEPAWVSADANPLRSIIIEKGQTPEQRQDRLRDRLGERARLDELETWLERNGGAEGLRTAFAGADGDRRERILGLLMDLSGLDLDGVKRRYQLEMKPPASQDAPMKVYRATLDDFDPARGNAALQFWTDSRAAADAYLDIRGSGKVTEGEIAFKNPYRLEDDDAAEKLAQKLGVRWDFQPYWDLVEHPNAPRVLQEMGHDGIVFDDSTGSVDHKTFMTFPGGTQAA